MKPLFFCLLICLLSFATLVGCGANASNSSTTPAEIVAADKASLAVGYAPGDTSSSVTQNLILPTSGTQGSTITWSSSNATVITTAGLVNRPLTGGAAVTLTATITIPGASDTKLFPVTVKPQMTDAEAVAAAKAALAIGYAPGDAAANVTKNLTLPATGLDNSVISWVSSNSAIVSDAGLVSQPSAGNSEITVTATITVGTASDTKDFVLVVKPRMTDAQAVADAKAAIVIGYAPGDADTTVTQNLSLSTTGLYGTAISWSSSDPAIAADGTVSRPLTSDLPVTLTATVSLRAASDTRDFIVTVKAQMTDAQAVAAAKQALQIGYIEGDLPHSVTQNLDLPVTGSSGCTISWVSSDPAVSSDGTVTRPSYGDTEVTLTATITSHEVSDQVSFTVMVKGVVSDADAVAAAIADLNIVYASGDSADSVTHNVNLPATGVDSCSVTWASDTPGTIAIDGTVHQPSEIDVVVTLTATISSHAVSDTKQFALTVKTAMSDAEAVATDKAALTIGYGPGDSATSVQHNLVLPTSGTNGSDIGWASSNPDVISSSGGLTVPSDSDAHVTMSAIIHKGEASDTATFDLTVKALLLSSWVDVRNISPGNGAIEVDPGRGPHPVPAGARCKHGGRRFPVVSDEQFATGRNHRRLRRALSDSEPCAPVPPGTRNAVHRGGARQPEGIGWSGSLSEPDGLQLHHAFLRRHPVTVEVQRRWQRFVGPRKRVHPVQPTTGQSFGPLRHEYRARGHGQPLSERFLAVRDVEHQPRPAVNGRRVGESRQSDTARHQYHDVKRRPR